MFVGGALAAHILKRFPWPDDSRDEPLEVYRDGKLQKLFGEPVWEMVRGKRVLDFGCGAGHECIECARHGAIACGVDYREKVLARARENTAAAGVESSFSTEVRGAYDVILSLDSMEHFHDPGAILETMAGALAPEGRVLISFGPPWYHPRGSHFPIPIPWHHLLFTEKAMMSWRAQFKTDGAKRFGEVEGGLNQMSIRRFQHLIERSPLEAAWIRLLPIRALRWLHNPLTREFTTAVVQAELRHRPRSG